MDEVCECGYIHVYIKRTDRGIISDYPTRSDRLFSILPACCDVGKIVSSFRVMRLPPLQKKGADDDTAREAGSGRDNGAFHGVSSGLLHLYYGWGM